MIRRFVYVKTSHLGMHPRLKIEQEFPIGLVLKHGFENFSYCAEPDYGVIAQDRCLCPDIDEKDWYYDEIGGDFQDEPL